MCAPLSQGETKKISNIEINNLKPPLKIEKSLGLKEKDTLLKMIIGMAIKGYAYDPNAKKNASIKDIADDLASLGISMDSDTVRKWIKQASELLPRDSL